MSRFDQLQWSALTAGLCLLSAPALLAQTSPATLPDLKLSTAGDVFTMVQQADGKIIIGGSFASVNGVPRANLARLNIDGSLDVTWSAGANSFVYALAISGQDLYVGGSFQAVGGQARNGLARVSLTDGRVDPNWIPSTNAGNAVFTILVNGTNIYAGGNFLIMAHTNLVRLTSTSPALADSWSPEPNGEVWALALGGTNLYVGGGFTRIGQRDRHRLAKIPTTGDGTADALWDPNVAPEVTNVDSHKVQQIILDGNSLFIRGNFNTVGTNYAFSGLSKISAMDIGAVDPIFRLFVFFTGPVDSIALNGTNLFVEFSWDGPFFVAKFNSISGAPETNAIAFPNALCRVLLAATNDTALYLGGPFSMVDGELSMGVARIDQVSGVRDPSYAQVENPGQILAIARQPDGKFLVAGDFFRAGTLRRQNLARVNTDGTLDASWAPDPDSRVRALAVDGTNIFIGGDFSAIGHTGVGHATRYGLAKLTTASDTADPDWHPDIRHPIVSQFFPHVWSLAVAETNLFFSGEFYLVNGLAKTNLAKVSTLGTGALDVAWKPNPSGRVLAMAVSGTNLFAGGEILYINGQTYTNVVKLNLYGSGDADPLWNARIAYRTNSIPGYPQWVTALAVDGTNLFLGGVFDAVGGQPRNGLAKVSTLGAGAVDSTWNPAPTNFFYPPQSYYPVSIAGLAVAGTNLYVSGSFVWIGGQSASLAKLSTFGAGQAVSSWQHPGIFAGPLQPTGPAGADLYVGGFFYDASGFPHSGLIFLPVADVPVMFQSPNSLLVITRNPADGPEVTHFRVTDISGGTLFRADGVTPVSVNDFITLEQGSGGLNFVASGSKGSVTAVAALNDTPAGAGAASATYSFGGSQAPVFSFGSAQYSVNESTSLVVLTVLKLTPGSASVSFSLQPGSAVPFDSSTQTGDYQPLTASPLTFTSSDTNQAISIFIYNDTLREGDETFTVTLTGASRSGRIAYPGTATVTILDDECPGPQGSFTNTVLPSPAPDATGGLRVDIQGPADGKWRLAGDPFWRDGGTTVIGLAAGYYEVDFKAVLGFQVPGPVTVLINAGMTNAITGLYSGNASQQLGNLIVLISPDAVATNGGQWKLPGGNWHASGETVTLAAGAYAVEFSSVTNWLAPGLATILVGANQNNIRPVAYQTNSGPGATAPQVLDFNAVTNPPYFYNGLLETDLGFGSGVVVKPRVVLTAAHVLFDDVQLSYSKKANWFLQKQRGVYEPQAQTARGWYIFDGYAAQRAHDNSPGTSSTASQNLDAAALYFVEINQPIYDPNLPGRGGAGGFLASDATPNPWLTGPGLKMLVGYPLEGVPETNWGKMHASAPANLVFANVNLSVYATSGIKSYPGNSGGPLYVQANGQYYPAAIYLGGGSKTLVRAIDKDVVCLINLAEITANGGGNFVGGGVALWSPGVTVSAFSGGLITATLGPPEALRARPQWHINRGNGDVSDWFDSGAQVVTEGQGTYPIEFRPITGFLTPAPTNVSALQANSIYSVDANYYPLITLTNTARLPNRAFRATLLGATGYVYTIQASTNLAPTTNWTTVATLINNTGAVQFTNDSATNFNGRFYRAQRAN